MSLDNNMKSLSQYRSASRMAAYMGEQIKNNILDKDTEKLDEDPVTFFSILASDIGDICEISLFETLMYKKETNVSTAILPRTLFSKLMDDEISTVFGSPSKTTFFLAYTVNDLLKYAVEDSEIKTIKRLRINKDSSFIIFGQQSFVLDHSIDIEIVNSDTENPTFKVSFDTSDKYSDNLSDVNNSLLNVKRFKYQKHQYVGFDIPARQYQRTYNEKLINSSEVNDMSFNFNNNLMGFEVLYKEVNKDNWIKLNGYPEGKNPDNSGYNYELSEKGQNQSLIIRFSKNSSGFKPALRSTLKIIIYTTMGEKGNMKFSSLIENPSALDFSLNQDKNNDYEMALTKIQPLLGVRQNESTGGKNQMTFEEIKNHIISRRNSSEIITDSSLKRKASEYGFTAENNRHDTLAINYTLSAYLKNTDGDYISSGSDPFIFFLDDLILRSDMKARLIKPSHIFTLKENENRFYFQKNPDVYKDYVSKYKKNTSTQVSFPYFIKIETTDSFNINVYDFTCPSNEYYTEALDCLTAIPDNVSVNNILIYRNPSAEKVIEDNTDLDGMYIISFKASTSDNTINLLESLEDPESFIKFRFVIETPTTGNQYYFDAVIDRNPDGSLVIDKENGVISLSAILTTSNNINSSDKLAFTNYCVKQLPITDVNPSQVYLDLKVNLSLYIIFQSDAFYQYKESKYDKFVSKTESEQKFYVGIVYNINEISFGNKLTDLFNFSGDIRILDTKYDVYTEPIYKTYDKNIFAYDEFGEMIYEEEIIIDDKGEEITIQVPKILHKKGDFILDLEGNKILKYDIGDPKLDENGEPVKLHDNKYYCILNDVPYYNRIYNVNNKFFDVVKAYDYMLDIISSMKTTVVDGISLILGLKRSSGKSQNYYYYDLESGEYKKLDNIAISLKIGVKFNSELTDNEKIANKELMKTLIKKYILEKSSENLSITDSLFSYLKEEIPSIQSLAHYEMNNFLSSQTQFITKILNADSVDNEILCLKYEVDEYTSDFTENYEKINLIPAITIVDIP